MRNWASVDEYGSLHHRLVNISNGDGVRADILGSFLITHRLKVPGWLATVTMAIMVLAMLATWVSERSAYNFWGMA